MIFPELVFSGRALPGPRRDKSLHSSCYDLHKNTAGMMYNASTPMVSSKYDRLHQVTVAPQMFCFPDLGSYLDY